MFGAPAGAWTGCGKSDFESLARRLMVPRNGWGGNGSTAPDGSAGRASAFFSWATAVVSRPEAVSQPSRVPTASSAAVARVVRVRMVLCPRCGGRRPGREPLPARDHWDGLGTVCSLREAEQRFRLLQLLQVRGPELLRLEVDVNLPDRARESERRLVKVAHRR